METMKDEGFRRTLLKDRNAEKDGHCSYEKDVTAVH